MYVCVLFLTLGGWSCIQYMCICWCKSFYYIDFWRWIFSCVVRLFKRHLASKLSLLAALCPFCYRSRTMMVESLRSLSANYFLIFYLLCKGYLTVPHVAPSFRPDIFVFVYLFPVQCSSLFNQNCIVYRRKLYHFPCCAKKILPDQEFTKLF